MTTNSYRMTPADSVALAQFQANVPLLPAGSSFRVSRPGSGSSLTCFPSATSRKHQHRGAVVRDLGLCTCDATPAPILCLLDWASGNAHGPARA